MASLQGASSKEDVCCSENRQQKTPEPSSTQAVIRPLPSKKEVGCGAQWNEGRVISITLCRVINLAAYLVILVLVHAPRPTKSASVVYWHLLLSFSPRPPFLFTLKAYYAGLTKTSPNCQKISHCYHNIVKAVKKTGGTLGIRSVAAMFYMVS